MALLVIWTITANILVFVVLYKNPHLQTVPNLLIGNLAFSDLCLGVIVLPLSSIYAIANEWLFTSTLCVVFVSADILCSTASIWNISIVGLDRYWAITTPISYMAKRNKRTAVFLILSVWLSSALISLAPFFGWKQAAERGNMIKVNGTWQCVFLDLPSYTIYSATGSFFIPLLIIFFVYYKIYRTFAELRARQLMRQQVIKKRIESTILHDLNHMVLIDDKPEKKASEEKVNNSIPNFCQQIIRPICKECKERGNVAANELFSSHGELRITKIDVESGKGNVLQNTKFHKDQVTSETTETKIINKINDNAIVFDNNITREEESVKCFHCDRKSIDKEQRCRCKKKTNVPDVFQHKRKSILAARERRGVKVSGIILGCFTICWTPFFIMYVLVQFCSSCPVDQGIWMFITWLGYSNSAMNPIIYTVFNQDYKNALKKLFRGSKQQTVRVKR